MMLKQLSLFIENKPGTLNAPCRILAEHGFSISTLSLADTKFFGVLRLLVKDWEKAAKLLESKGFAVKLTDVVALEIDHRAGSLSSVLEVFDKHAINVEYMYAFAPGYNGKAVIIFRFDDPEAALEKLKSEQNAHILDYQDLFGKD